MFLGQLHFILNYIPCFLQLLAEFIVSDIKEDNNFEGISVSTALDPLSSTALLPQVALLRSPYFDLHWLLIKFLLWSRCNSEL